MAQATAASETIARTEPDRNLALDLLRVTEAAAMAAGRWVGRRDKDGADAVAVAAMRAMMVTVAVSVLAVAPRGAMYDPSAVFYMDKLVAGPEAIGVLDIRQSPEENIVALARAKGCTPGDITVCMLERPRHDELAKRVIHAGARIKFITDGDVAAAVMAASLDSGVDLLLGIGGTPAPWITATRNAAEPPKGSD